MEHSTESMRRFLPHLWTSDRSEVYRRGFRSRLGRRLLWYVVLFSSAVTLVITLAQLYREYRNDMWGVQQAFAEVDIVHLQSLERQLWAQDFPALRIQLAGILAMREVDRVVLQEFKGRRIALGGSPSARMLEHKIALTYRYRGRVQQLGTLSVWSDLGHIRNRLLKELVFILIGNGIKTFLVSGFVLLLFYQLIGRHLYDVGAYLNALSPEGERVPLRLRRSHTPGHTDELDLVVQSINDIRERLSNSIAQLKEGEARLTFLMEQSTEGILIHDDRTIVNLSPGACKLLGGTPADFIGKYPLEAIAPEFRTEVAEKIERNEGGDFELECLRLDGSRFPARGQSRYSTYQGRKVRVVAFQDVTEHRVLEARLRESQKLEAVGVLAGGVAHNFNNMLQVISGFTALARAKARYQPELMEDLDQVAQAAERASGVTRELLAFSRHEPIRARALDLPMLVEGQVQMLRPLLSERIQVEFEAAPDCLPVSADAGLIEQVIMNLCINARDAMPDGGRIRIALRNVLLDDAARPQQPGQPGRPFVEIAVADAGTGMTPEVRAHLFEPFYTTKARGKGTGLGLSITYGIVMEHGGRIEVESEPGSGSVFRVYLPAVESTAEGPGGHQDASQVPVGQETILVAEDQPEVRAVIGAFLRGHGYHTVMVSNGREAVDAVAAEPNRFNLALLDLDMPGLGGQEAYEAIQRICNIPALFCTGHVDGSVDSDALRASGVSLIRKPFEEQDLLVAVRNALNPRRT